MSVRDYFPGIDRLLHVARAWPRVFAEPPEGTLPIAVEGDRLVVLCAGDAQHSMVQGSADQVVRLLNRLLDGDVVIAHLEAVPATRTELFLARGMLALKSWLADYDIGSDPAAPRPRSTRR